MQKENLQKLRNAFGDITYLPKWEDIPEEFKDRNNRNKWVKVVDDWFFKGLPADTKFLPKAGVDAKTALKNISGIMNSWAPQHEHKTAGCAYLLSQNFEDVQYE
jgi:hypothetical protein